MTAHHPSTEMHDPDVERREVYWWREPEDGRDPAAFEAWLNSLPGRLVTGPLPWPFDPGVLYAVTVEASTPPTVEVVGMTATTGETPAFECNGNCYEIRGDSERDTEFVADVNCPLHGPL